MCLLCLCACSWTCFVHFFGHSIALAELLAHVEDAQTDESVALVLKLADLVKLYTA